MRKPSIFSSDYNKKMKKRRIVLSISIILIIVVGGISVTLIKSNINFADIRNEIQAWIDSDNQGEIVDLDNEKPENIEQIDTTQPEVPKGKLLELPISEGRMAKVEYEEINGEKKIKEVNSIPENIYYNISPSKKLILFIDEMQNIKLYNTNGEMIDLTNENYTSKNGEKFTKQWALSTYKDYVWHKDAKFIDDNKIAYISSVPYFGNNLDKYVWIVDVDKKNYTTLWSLKGKDVLLGDVKDNRLEVTIDGSVKYIDTTGNIVN